jgi:hypothetical protein
MLYGGAQMTTTGGLFSAGALVGGESKNNVPEVSGGLFDDEEEPVVP